MEGSYVESFPSYKSGINAAKEHYEPNQLDNDMIPEWLLACLLSCYQQHCDCGVKIRVSSHQGHMKKPIWFKELCYTDIRLYDMEASTPSFHVSLQCATWSQNHAHSNKRWQQSSSRRELRTQVSNPADISWITSLTPKPYKYWVTSSVSVADVTDHWGKCF